MESTRYSSKLKFKPRDEISSEWQTHTRLTMKSSAGGLESQEKHEEAKEMYRQARKEWKNDLSDKEDCGTRSNMYDLDMLLVFLSN